MTGAQLDVLSYNVFLRSPTLLFLRDRHGARVRQLPPYLRRYDVLVLQEAFSDPHRQVLIDGLASSHPFATGVLGQRSWRHLNGGVVIVSRWPIELERQLTFGDACAGIDSLADKGVLYARIRKPDRAYHVFGTHAQVGQRHRDVRWRQLAMIKEFIGSLGIPAGEPVILAGDLNVDLHRDDTDGEYSEMTRFLDMTHPEPPAGVERIPTQDGLRNDLVRYEFRKHLDYVLYSNAHLAPLRAFNDVQVLRQGGRDLSDHYAVHGHFVFPIP